MHFDSEQQKAVIMEAIARANWSGREIPDVHAVQIQVAQAPVGVPQEKEEKDDKAKPSGINKTRKKVT